ncbi:hypothetical protein [Agaribacterium sp. ZY112]|uniref:hypothetical protein n=1 Tax=Agaribacterium sp. ZY112 TaxID=3233574 RepID=UPI003524DACB
MQPRQKVVLIGAGDLAVRIAAGLQLSSYDIDIDLVSRSPHVYSKACLLNSSAIGANFARVAAYQVDVLDSGQLESYIEHAGGDIYINCASLLSPWAYLSTPSPTAKKLGSLAFAAQLCAQLPAAFRIADSLRRLGAESKYINCSFPDSVNVILAKNDLAPLCGLGNAGMLHRFLQVHNPRAEIRVVAHHAVVQALLCGDYSNEALCYVEFNGEPRSWSDLVVGTAPLERNILLNQLTAAHAVDVVIALLDSSRSLSTSLPSPSGLAGGYPCRIEEGRLISESCQYLSHEQAITLNKQAAKLDGIEHIDECGMVHLTSELKNNLPESLRFMEAPLNVENALDQFGRLNRLLSNANKV